jgi:hypothetical protein
MIGWIAGIQSNGERSGRHPEHKIFLPIAVA